MLKTAVLGIPVGLAFGYALQRGRFCMNTAFRDVLVAKDFTLLRAYVVAVLVQLVGLNFLADLGVITRNMAPFFWQATILGGFVFGFGMATAGGCGSGISYRSGEGMVASIIALVGFGVGVTMTNFGVVQPFQRALRATIIPVGPEPTLSALLGVSPWVLIGIIGAAGTWWCLRGKVDAYARGWKWPVAGGVIGLIGIAAWVLSASTGRQYGLSVTEPIATLFRYLFTGETRWLNWASFMWLGIPVGAFLGAFTQREFAWRAPGPLRLLQTLGGGTLMGVGAGIAGGCNIGHSLTGVSMLALSSMTATMGIIAGVWLGVYVLFGKVVFERSAKHA